MIDVVNGSKRMWRVGLVVPAEWKEKVQTRVKAKGYTSVGEYVRDLIREDLEKAGLLSSRGGEE